MNSMNNLFDFDQNRGVVRSEQETIQRRIKMGFCKDCGNQLYIIKRRKFNPLVKKKIPVTNQHSLNGRCLDCDPIENTGRKATSRSMLNINQRLHQSTQNKIISGKYVATTTARRCISNINQIQDQIPQNKIANRKHVSARGRCLDYDPIENIGRKNTSQSMLIINQRQHQSQHNKIVSGKYAATTTAPRFISDINQIQNQILQNKITNRKHVVARGVALENVSDFSGHKPQISFSDNCDNRNKSTLPSINNKQSVDNYMKEDLCFSNEAQSNVQQIISELFSESLHLSKKLILCKSLLSLAADNYVKVEIIISGGIMAIHNVMNGEHISDEGLQNISCAILQMLLPVADDLLIKDLPIVESITRVMLHHQKSIKIQEMCINILRHLSERNGRYKKIIADNGGMDIAYSSINLFPSSNIRGDSYALIENLIVQ